MLKKALELICRDYVEYMVEGELTGTESTYQKDQNLDQVRKIGFLQGNKVDDFEFGIEDIHEEESSEDKVTH